MLQRFSVDKAPEILVQGVSKTFRQGDEELHVLKNVNFHAKAGELVMIVGPSGSGKTTLLSAIAGTLGIDSGIIRLFDFEMNLKTSKEIIDFRRQKIGFIFQQFHLIPTLTCTENVAIPLLLNGFSHDQAMEEAHRSLTEVGLESKSKVSPRGLSGGQQQRVAIARALIHKPSLIICDEPTAALDSETGIKVMELIRQHVTTPGRVVIIVTHDNRIFKYADRIEKMDDGQITKGTE
jgi:putative ABC transport system ATP-binding protein